MLNGQEISRRFQEGAERFRHVLKGPDMFKGIVKVTKGPEGY